MLFRFVHFLIGAILLFGHSAFAQEEATAMVYIEAVQFDSLKRTKPRILYREVPLQVGDSVALTDLVALVEEGRQRLMNTGLFVTAEGNVKEWSANNRVSIVYTLREQFFLTGYLIFDLADRNFNVWWEEQMHSLDRIDYGFRVSHENISGRADELSLGLTLGFTRKIDLSYDNPGINRARTLGLKTRFYFAQNRETNYTTEGDKFLFYRGNDFQLQRFKVETRLSYRPRFDYYHYLEVNFYQNKTADDIAKDLNQDFFLDQRISQRYVELGYSMIIDKRIQKPYTLKGWYARLNIIQSGVGIFKDRQQTILRTTLAKYFSFGKKWSLELFNRNQIFLTKTKQAYFNNRGLGDRKDFLVGYELYALDGTDFGYLKSSIRFIAVDQKINFPRIKWLEKMRILPIPLQVYLTLNNDVGYVREAVYQEKNNLVNEGLWGAGLGLDFVIYYDKILQVQYSFNHLLEKGLFLHYKQKF